MQRPFDVYVLLFPAFLMQRPFDVYLHLCAFFIYTLAYGSCVFIFTSLHVDYLYALKQLFRCAWYIIVCYITEVIFHTEYLDDI